GILQMPVRQSDAAWPGGRQTSGRGWRDLVDVEIEPARAWPPPPLKLAGMNCGRSEQLPRVTQEPDVRLGIVGAGEHATLFGRANLADDLHLTGKLTLGPGPRVLVCLRHKAAIYEDPGIRPSNFKRREDPISRAFMRGALGCAGEQMALPGMVEAANQAHRRELARLGQIHFVRRAAA